MGRLYAPGSQNWSPEAVVGPQWHRQVTISDSEASGSAFGTHREVAQRFGLRAAVGASMELGPGEGVARLGIIGSTLNGTLTGKSGGTLGPYLAVGYRLVR